MVSKTPMLEDDVNNAQKSKSKVKSTCRTHPDVMSPDREVLIYDVSQSEWEFMMGMIMLHQQVK